MPVSRKPKIRRSEIDFSYALSLPFRVRRLACTYEYSRECPTLVAIINAVRRAGIFSESYRNNNPEVLNDLRRAQEAIGLVDTIYLAGIDEFPTTPFHDAWRIRQDYLQDYDQTRTVGWTPWKPLILLRRQFALSESDEIAFWNAHQDLTRWRYAISIDWINSDAEIIADFSELIRKLRPLWCPEPQMAGRHGRKPGTGAIDMLNQLGALRSRRARLSFQDAKRLTVYITERGWREAANRAEKRIHHLMSHPLFESDRGPGIKLPEV